jgi:anaerobic ribonucleoside-triphosphate reductase
MAKKFSVQRDLLAGIISKEFGLNDILPKAVANSHKAGEIHFHDLDYSPFFGMFNCMLIDIKFMFENGFKMNNADISSPKSIATACAVAAQIITQVASNIYGGNTINRADEVFAPYVTLSYNKHLETAIKWDIKNCKDFAMEQTEKECHNAFQSLEYEINTMSST